jgi:hypothetical protein
VAALPGHAGGAIGGLQIVQPSSGDGQLGGGLSVAAGRILRRWLEPGVSMTAFGQLQLKEGCPERERSAWAPS